MPVVYLTFNDPPTGIYSSQVIGVCRFLSKELKADVRLVAFISIRQLRESKKKIRAAYPGAIVLPMFPRVSNWRLNRFLLRWALRKIKPSGIIARGPFAANLAQICFDPQQVCFDGRGAYIAELHEYNVVPDENVKKEIRSLEEKATLGSGFRLAVSEALVNYWKREFNYNASRHVVIPCTLNDVKETATTDREELRAKQGFDAGDVIIVYSGSFAGWQSFGLMDEWLLPAFRQQKNLRLVMLTGELPADFKLAKEFPQRVSRHWLPHQEVAGFLAMADYGWLVREKTVTNEVASPVKFAEYLAAGLPVLISEGLGDYTEFVSAHHAGAVCRPGENFPSLEPVDDNRKSEMKKLARDYFRKEVYRNQYLEILGKR